jgi:hypothetical protein
MSALFRMGSGAMTGMFAAMLFLPLSSTGRSETVNLRFLGGDQCFMFSLLVPQRHEGNHMVTLPFHVIIDDESAYRKLFEPKILRKDCAAVDLTALVPKVNFANETVLGLWMSGTCSDTGFQREVTRDESRRVVRYSVATINGPQQACMGPGPESLNLMAVPKIQAGYRILFNEGG